MICYASMWLIIGIILAAVTITTKWFWILQVILALGIRRFLLVIILILAGMYYYQLRYHFLLNWQLPTSWIKRPLTVEGVVVGLPKQTAAVQQFRFQTQHQHTLRLSWYNSKRKVRYGQQWRFTVSLKPPLGLLNPGSFNYGRWLVLNGIQATGYVKNEQAHLIKPAKIHTITYWRQGLQKIIHDAIANPDRAGLIAALTIGSHDLIQPPQWQVFQRTGTNHLMAISGLHIGFVAGFGFLLMGFLWRRSTYLMLWQPVAYAQALAAIVAALIYGFMAGFSLPTQRAVVMVLIVMLALLSKHSVALWMRLVFAFCMLVLWDPFVLYSASLWMSFGSVAWITYVCSGRFRPYTKWMQWWRLQIALLIGLAPLTLYYYHQVSVVSFIANALAVPWVGFMIVPLCLVAAFASGLNLSISSMLFKIAGFAIAPLWYYLQWLAGQRWAVWPHVIAHGWIVVLGLIAAALLLLPRAVGGRWFGLFLGLPLIFYKPAGPQKQELWVTTLAVGQGLSTLVRTSHHALLYDAGPKSYSGFDAGASVVVPYLQFQGIHRLDMMMVSHGDNDHIGGAPAVIQALPVQTILTSVPKRFKTKALYCYRGQRWHWDGVRFEVLWPLKGSTYADNNSSCVLRITDGRVHILLTGDIESPVENWLVHNEARYLPAMMLVAPHHGSRSSSTEAFILKVRPRLVIFPTGAYNRYHFPSTNVVERYAKIRAKLYNTALDGAISVQFNTSGILHIKTARGKSKKLL